ncbi:MAG: FxsA family protein [Pseudomonadota bacterium]
MPFIILIVFVGLETWGILRMIERVGTGAVGFWLLGAGLLGGVMIARGGLNALARIRIAMGRGELPAAEIFQGLLTAFAGLLLILPGFITDLLAVSLLISGAGVKKRLGERLSASVAQARPDLKKPVTLDGEYRRK